MRARKQAAALVVVVIAVAAVLTAIRFGSSSAGVDGTEQGITIDSELAAALAVENDEDYMERYGVPENGLFVVNIPDSVAESLDYESINGLKVYTAEPHYTEDGLLEMIADLAYGGNESLVIEKSDYAMLTSGSFTGWGNYYTYSDPVMGGYFLDGSPYLICYYGDRVTGGLDASGGDRYSYLLGLIEELHLGIWDGDDNWMSLTQVDDDYFTTDICVDGIGMDKNIYGYEYLDSDGARYTAGLWMDAYFKEDGLVRAIEGIYSADIIGSRGLGQSYGGVDDIVSAIKASYNEHYGNDPESGHVYEVSEMHVAYYVGHCEDMTFLITPWVVLTVTGAYYNPNQGIWIDIEEKELYLNLSSQTAGGF